MVASFLDLFTQLFMWKCVISATSNESQLYLQYTNLIPRLPCVSLGMRLTVMESEKLLGLVLAHKNKK